MKLKAFSFSIYCLVFLIFPLSLVYGGETFVSKPTGRQICVGIIKIACNSDKARTSIAKTFLKKMPKMKLQFIDDKDYLVVDGLSINFPVKILEYEGLFRSVNDAYSYLEDKKISEIIPSNACLMFEKKIVIRDEYKTCVLKPQKFTFNEWNDKLSIDLMKYIPRENMEKTWKFFGKNGNLPEIVGLVLFDKRDIEQFRKFWSKYFEQYPLREFRYIDVPFIQIGTSRTFVTCGIFETFEEEISFFQRLHKKHYEYVRKKNPNVKYVFLPPPYVYTFVSFGKNYFLADGRACGRYSVTNKKIAIEPTIKKDLQKEYKIIAGVVENNKSALNYVLLPDWARKLVEYFPESLSYQYHLYNNVVSIDCGNFTIKYTDYKNFRLETGMKLALNKQIALLASQYKGIIVSPDFDLSTAFVKYIIEKLPDNIFSDWEFYKKNPEDKYIGKVLVIVSALEWIKNGGNISLLNQIIEDFVKNKLAKRTS